MEGSYSTTSAQSAASFFYYTPDPQARPRHHGHFLPHPQSAPQLLAPSPISPMSFPSQLVYGEQTNNRSLAPTLCITPATSPSLMKSRGSLSTETNNLCLDSASSDFLFNPATPPLSHSAMSTPAMTHAMLTPMSNHGWSQEEPTCGTIAPFEMQLPGTPVDWNAGSPDYSPLYVFPGLSLPSNASPPPSIVINDSYCPALSPSSSHTSSSPDLDFCDPRHLTFPSPAPAESEFGMSFPVLPTLIGEDEEHNLLLGSGDLVSIKTEDKSFNAYGFDFIDDLSDFESEDDFISSFANNTEDSYSTPEDDNTQLSRSSRESSCSDEHDSKRRHTHSSDCSDSDEEEMTEEERVRAFKFGHGEGHHRSSSKPNGMPINPNVIRRGRKQSLTEDPSKTFVCHLCNRRFRRQEHLKRHFRSLHTEDKPFSCGECGKKFSRSDNLTQHARIHGSGAILLGVLDENEVMDGHHQFMSEEISQPLGIVVVDALQAAAGDVKQEAKSNEAKRNNRKRRRNEE
jgi:hypothetical protein